MLTSDGSGEKESVAQLQPLNHQVGQVLAGPHGLLRVNKAKASSVYSRLTADIKKICENIHILSSSVEPRQESAMSWLLSLILDGPVTSVQSWLALAANLACFGTVFLLSARLSPVGCHVEKRSINPGLRCHCRSLGQPTGDAMMNYLTMIVSLRSGSLGQPARIEVRLQGFWS